MIEIKQNETTIIEIKKPEIVYNIPGGVVPSGILYNRKNLFSFNTISVRLYDEVWRLMNGEFNFEEPENPIYIQDLDMTAEYPKYRLKYPNKWGNYDRFTDIEGGSEYEDSRLMQDHLLGCVYYYAEEAEGINHEQIAYDHNYAEISDWRLATALEVYPNLDPKNIPAELGNMNRFYNNDTTNYLRLSTKRSGDAYRLLLLKISTYELDTTSNDYITSNAIYISYFKD